MTIIKIEKTKASQKLRNRKAARIEDVTGEMLKYCGAWLRKGMVIYNVCTQSTRVPDG